MSFILGFFMGLVAAIVLLLVLIYWLCRRGNNIAVAKVINGIAHALAHKPKPSQTVTTPEEENGRST